MEVSTAGLACSVHLVPLWSSSWGGKGCIYVQYVYMYDYKASARGKLIILEKKR